MTLVLLTIATLLLGMWAWSRFRPDPVGLADRAVSTGQFAPVFTALHRVSVSNQPTEYHRVIKRLWDGYHREEAVEVAKDFARHHREAPTAQFWLREFLEKEPEIAREHLDEAFMAAFHDRAIAAKCGKFG